MTDYLRTELNKKKKKLTGNICHIKDVALKKNYVVWILIAKHGQTKKKII